MTDLIPSSNVKITNFKNDLKFRNDFGETPIGLGRFTKDQGFIAVASVVGFFVGAAWGGLPLAAVVVVAGLNDISYARRGANTQEPESEPEPSHKMIGATTRVEAINVPTSPVQDDADSAINYLGSNPHIREAAHVQDRKSSQQTPRSKEELIIALKQQCPALLRLVKSHPIRAVGFQRSGKTTLVKKLALLRMILLPNHRTIAATPHYEADNPYPKVFQVVGIKEDGKRDYPAISREWFQLAQRVEASKINSITTIWDEFGLFDKVMDEEQLTSVLTSCLRETLKFGEYPIFIAHGETIAFLPGSKGLVTVFLNGTVRVETIGEIVEGPDGLESVRPTGKFTIQWLDGSKDSGQIPEWLTEELLIGMLPPSADTKDNSVEQEQSTSPQTDKQAWDRMILEATDKQINELIDKMRSKETSSPDNEAENIPSHPEPKQRKSLDEAEQKLVEFAKEKPHEWLSPSWFTNNKEYFKTWKSEQVIELFHKVKDKGYGDTIWSNGTRKFRLENPES